MLRVLSTKKRRYFYEQQIGTHRKVLFEDENKNGFMYGFTENYVQVKTSFKKEWCNQLVRCHLNKIDSDGIFIMKEI